ncbi:MAG: isoprenylcysteine carboxylmethyltransferase family protein [Alphaproteobacteria bacterium]|jgi:protein-S-isoprenylcysteine O-methyltransferase Ste14|nr:isoprenylcysteine carboxylmethyltransferase family protein [Alphaproteobacteria bacterium]
MNWSFAKAILILPGTALVYVPAAIIGFTQNTGYAAVFPPEGAASWIGAVFPGLAGLVLMGWTVRLFATQGGGGTPAPWEPISKFIITGPYRHTRNPMLTGVLFFQAAESIFLHSWPLAAWTLFFFVLNTIYFIFSEEPGLAKRYGAAYLAYKRQVPRWLPRMTPYRPT